MKKITYEPLTSPRHAHEKSIVIWTVLANMPDGTFKSDVLDYACGRYECDCPLCHYYLGSATTNIACAQCPLSLNDNTRCYGALEPFSMWGFHKTAANAQAVLNQLHDTYKQRYGEEYRFNLNTGTGEIMGQLKNE